MRRLDETPIDPEIAASLDAIDAVLAGDPVDPRHAELAELALLLAAERPEPDPAFAGSLDARVQRRFAPAPAATADGGANASSPAGRSRRRWWLASAGGLCSAAVAAAVVVVVISGSGGTSQPGALGAAVSSTAASAPATKVASPAVRTAKHASPSAQTLSEPATTPSSPANAPSSPGALSSSAASSAAAPPGAGSSAAAPGAPVLQPPANGRKIVQGAQLALMTASGRVDTVAQEVFDVVAQQNGFVKSSTVTAAGGQGGYAQFQLSVPSSSLPQTMAALSSVRYAHVASRTDTTQDVNDQYQSDVRRLADARALRTSLLKQLANASTQAQIDSLNAQIHDAEASISSDEATLRGLNAKISYSQVAVTINAGAVPVPVHSSGGAFTIRKAAHDAGRVLTVAAGVALIAAAALLPIALLGALAWWVAAALRRRRREQALDTV